MPDSGPPIPPRRPRGTRFLAQAIRSGARRYPTHLKASLRSPLHAVAPARVLEPTFPDAHPLAASWLGHASVIVQLAGVRVLVDPVFSHRIGPRIAGRTFGLHRHDDLAGVRLPPIDLVLITHAHFDHLDRPTLERLADSRTRVVAPLRAARLIPRGFGDIIELAPGATLATHGIAARAVSPRHWGSRTPLRRGLGVNAYLLEPESHSAPGPRVLLAGDTALTRAFDATQPDLAVFGIGAYEPWAHAHATPEQVWRMFRRSGGRSLLPVHYGSFPLSDEPPEAPLRRLLQAAGEAVERVAPLAPGEVWVQGSDAGEQ
ncbi:MAG: MBL fold metallo-hydrolase [Phycisphaerales bacterium]|jgi:L-ascorbate metabolism protein UlaG (beta-lactamase superfamily)|nr:MBL fold metallo-hydrolase [Phycisphaerales bacterium]